MTFRFLGNPKVQYFDPDTGNFLVGGKCYAYLGGMPVSPTNAVDTYPSIQDAVDGTNPNSWPVELDDAGQASVVLAGPTKWRVTDADDNELFVIDYAEPIATNANIYDTNGNLLVSFTENSSSVNNFNVSNATLGNDLIIAAEGIDTDIGIIVRPKGAGVFQVDGDLSVSGDTANLNIAGKTGAAHPDAGVLGEVLSANGSNGGLSSGTVTNLASKLFTAGNWLISGNVRATAGANISNFVVSLSTTSATHRTNNYEIHQAFSSITTDSGSAPQLILSVSVSTTVYLVVTVTGTGTLTAAGELRGVRIS